CHLSGKRLLTGSGTDYVVSQRECSPFMCMALSNLAPSAGDLFSQTSHWRRLRLSIQHFAHLLRKVIRSKGLLEKVGSRGQDAVMDDSILSIARHIEDLDLGSYTQQAFCH